MKFTKEKHLSKHSPIRQSKANKGKLVTNEGKIPDNAMNGTAVSVIGNTVIAEINLGGKMDFVECSVSGKIKSPYQNSTLVAVGDNVIFIPEESDSGEIKKGRVIAIGDRLSKISRRAVGKATNEHVIASNFDILLLLASAFQPSYNKRFIDRLLIAAEIGSVRPVIGLNKIDLTDDVNVFLEDLEIYNKMGIQILTFSASKGIGIDSVIELTKDKTTLFFGPSGIGKSTLVNKLIGNSVQKITEISERTNKGQHTTTFVKMLDLPYGGRIIDSPGVREFAMWDVDKLNLAMHFHDFDDYYLNCKYLPCTHTHEPECAVLEALDNEQIDYERYESYLNILESLEN
ncbi:MAG: ribosome small subunit-dependent GTPase A [Candidatus Kapabacteria bacterium]|nr:ribosome small subunit-dependent GTPase A [Ignavibacteriota bacterium]MCW5883719.1 ribosome small subunit-dependent GTPase A [Candidatus Kapabacteria bacterium]